MIHSRHSILVIDDSPSMLEAFRVVFDSSYLVITAENGIDGIALARKANPSLIILDINMPGMNGIEVCKRLRNAPSTANIPVIISSANCLSDARIKAFDCGADDFIPRPYNVEEIRARVAARILRYEDLIPKPRHLIFDGIILDLDKIVLVIDGASTKLSYLEFNLLRCFLENVDKVISRKFILDKVWVDATVGPRTVDTHVVSLRKKLDKYKEHLVTSHGAGYIFASEKTK
jgi:DNA-binding response OmpR family regulator